MNINEILKEENVGKRFKFSANGKIYIVEKVSNKSFELFDEDDEYLTDSVYLSEILKVSPFAAGASVIPFSSRSCESS